MSGGDFDTQCDCESLLHCTVISTAQRKKQRLRLRKRVRRRPHQRRSPRVSNALLVKTIDCSSHRCRSSRIASLIAETRENCGLLAHSIASKERRGARATNPPACRRRSLDRRNGDKGFPKKNFQQPPRNDLRELRARVKSHESRESIRPPRTPTALVRRRRSAHGGVVEEDEWLPTSLMKITETPAYARADADRPRAIPIVSG
jgi:hypothetical protein